MPEQPRIRAPLSRRLVVHEIAKGGSSPTVYVRPVSLKDALSDAEEAAYWKWTLEEVVPALLRVPGIPSVKLYYTVWDTEPSGLQAKILDAVHLIPNCTASPRPVAFIDVLFDDLMVNASAVPRAGR